MAGYSTSIEKHDAMDNREHSTLSLDTDKAMLEKDIIRRATSGGSCTVTPHCGSYRGASCNGKHLFANHLAFPDEMARFERQKEIESCRPSFSYPTVHSRVLFPKCLESPTEKIGHLSSSRAKPLPPAPLDLQMVLPPALDPSPMAPEPCESCQSHVYSKAENDDGCISSLFSQGSPTPVSELVAAEVLATAIQDGAMMPRSATPAHSEDLERARQNQELRIENEKLSKDINQMCRLLDNGKSCIANPSGVARRCFSAGSGRHKYRPSTISLASRARHSPRRNFHVDETSGAKNDQFKHSLHDHDSFNPTVDSFRDGFAALASSLVAATAAPQAASSVTTTPRRSATGRYLWIQH